MPPPPPGSPPKLVGSPKVPDKLGPSTYGHYLSQAVNPAHDWSQDPTEQPEDKYFRAGTRLAGGIGATAGVAATGCLALGASAPTLTGAASTVAPAAGAVGAGARAAYPYLRSGAVGTDGDGGPIQPRLYR
jgi:hypothetical protein